MEKMDEEMEENEVEYTFTVVEVDLDYEFDAARYFDFSQEETSVEASQAELWFESAPNYPPSPFVANLIPESFLLQNVNTSPKPKQEENVDMSESDSNNEVDERVPAGDRGDEGKQFNNRGTSNRTLGSNIWKFKSQPQQLPSGTFYNPMMKGSLKAKPNSSKPSLSKTSTLMKPTASQLAKQNQPQQTGNFRFQKLLVDKNEKSLNTSCGFEVQATKRQKLEGGHLCKVNETKQQMNFIHKLPKKDGNADGNNVQPKLRLTIPREPDLVTAYRAQRMRPNTGKETENLTATVRKFKALPLNRKILEAPSLLLPKRSTPRLPEFQEFHLKTSERAMHHTSAASMPSVSCTNHSKELNKYSANTTVQSKNESMRSNVPDTSRPEVSDCSHNFKALPLNKKIFSSKGDMGVFRNNKKDVTVPMEFNFHRDKRVQYNLPTELFNKLSLTSEPQSNPGSMVKLPLPPSSTVKGLKENRWDSFQHENEVKHAVKEKLLSSGAKQLQFGSSRRITDVGSAAGIGRGLGIR